MTVWSFSCLHPQIGEPAPGTLLATARPRAQPSERSLSRRYGSHIIAVIPETTVLVYAAHNHAVVVDARRQRVLRMLGPHGARCVARRAARSRASRPGLQ